MRIFIAVAIPEDLRQRVAEIQKRLRAVPADVRWVETDKFHLTLKFLGEVGDEKVSAVAVAVAGAVRGCAPFAVSLEGLGAFPGVRAPRVVWAGIGAGKEQLQALAGRVDDALAAAGWAKEKRDFAGHLTLGRVRSARNREALTKRMILLQETQFGSFCVRGIDVMRSILRPQGSHYECLESISM